VRVHFAEQGWEDYQHWIATDPDILASINALLADTRQRPHAGLGKPEPLKGSLAGWWSRRITREHRLVYAVEGRRGVDQRIIIAQCRYHC